MSSIPAKLAGPIEDTCCPKGVSAACSSRSFNCAAPPPPMDQGVGVEGVAGGIAGADEVAFGAGMVELVEDGGPDEAFGRGLRVCGVLRGCRRRCGPCWPWGGRCRAMRMTVGVPWRGCRAPLVSMTWGEVDGGDELLDELLAELAFHEAVGRDLAGVAAGDGEDSYAFEEGHGQGVLPVAGGVAFAVGLVEDGVLGRDVRGDWRRRAWQQPGRRLRRRASRSSLW